MSAARQLIADLAARGIHMLPWGDQIRFCPADRLAADDLATLRQHKAKVLQLIRAPILPGTEHFGLYIDVDGDTPQWLEFIPGYHHDIRQSSRLTGLCGAAELATDVTRCTRCGSTEFVDVPIHNGQSLRHDCAQCTLPAAWPHTFPLWYGVPR